MPTDLKPSTATTASALDGTELIPCTQGGNSRALTPAQIRTLVETLLSTLTVDNLNLNGNTLSSTDANGPINLTPNGIGQVQLQDGLMSAPALVLASGAGVGIGKTPAAFGLIHSATVYTDVRNHALAVRNSDDGAQGGIAAVLPSATVPNLCPDVIADADTGIGRAGADKLSLIAGLTEITRAEFSGGAAKIGFLGKTGTPAAAQTGGAATAGAVYTATEQTMLQAAYDCLRAFGLLA